MEVLSPSPLTSPYISSPRSPTHFGGGNDHHHLYYSSAPTSPSRVADFYRSFNNFSFNNRNHDQAQDQDGNTHHDDDDDKDKEQEQEDDFAFDFSGQVSKTSLSADELFDGGKIRPIQLDNNNIGAEEEARIRRPRSPNESPRGRRKDLNPFVNSNDQERGRERVVSVFTSAARSSRRVTRSLSPYRTTDLAWEEDHQQQQQQQQQSTKPTSSNSKSSSKKWRLRDFLLFRSASEGRATSKYSVVTKKGEELRGSKGVRSNDGPVSRRRGPVSAHELHYKSNRAVSEEMKRRTFLPYKQGLFGWFTRG